MVVIIIPASFVKTFVVPFTKQCEPEVLTPSTKHILCHIDWSDQVLMGRVFNILQLTIVKTEPSQYDPEAVLHWKTEACDLQKHQGV